MPSPGAQPAAGLRSFGRPDKGVIRLLAWLGLASATVLLFYYTQLLTSLSLLQGIPGLPFAALLGVLLVLRWNDLRSFLNKEVRLASRFPTRALGLGLAFFPLVFAQYSVGSQGLSAITVILVFYGISLFLNPTTLRILLPYAGLCAAGLAAPTAIQDLIGEPFAGLATYLSAGMVRLGGIPVVWHGTQFVLISRVGDSITGTVTPGCSSILSVTTFLGLLGLMHFDLRKNAGYTLKLAIAGTVALVLLNSVRIGILIWTGYLDGSATFWWLHDWLGYAIFLGFYMVVLMVYFGMGSNVTSALPSTQARSFTPLNAALEGSRPNDFTVASGDGRIRTKWPLQVL